MGVDARGFPGEFLSSIPPLRISSLLPHDLCHGWSASLWPPTTPEQLERQAKFHSSIKDEAWLSCPNSAGTLRLKSEGRGTLRFLPQLRMRPSSFAPNPVESREAPPNSTVSVNSQRHHEKLPDVSGISRGNPGFPAATRERPRESLFNAS